MFSLGVTWGKLMREFHLATSRRPMSDDITVIAIAVVIATWALLIVVWVSLRQLQ